MDTKHTRGPWKVGEELASDGDFVIKATSGYGIGQAWNLNGNTENAANARLIAAAPELIKALAGCADALREAGKDFARANKLAVRPNLYELHEQAARAAIAKATGTNI